MSLISIPTYIPTSVTGSIKDLIVDDEMLYWYPWITSLKNDKIWLALSQKWKPDGDFPELPPPGYEYYIVSGDTLMFGLAEKIVEKTGATVIQLSGPIIDNTVSTDKAKYLPYTSDHRRINRLSTKWPITKNIKYKTSALTNRVTHSKAIIFSALKDLLNDQDFVGSLNHAHVHLKNVHYWQMSGNPVCDYYFKKFIDEWADKKIILPDDDNQEGSYNNPAFQNSALNFTQESHHYSYMIQNNKSYIEPGPFLTEKTFKCVLSQTAFIPVGQYKSYTCLENLGMKFDYGALDLSFDLDPGNLGRLEKIVTVIESLREWTAQELFEMTRESTLHNYDLVMNKTFWNNCEKLNAPSIEFLANL